MIYSTELVSESNSEAFDRVMNRSIDEWRDHGYTRIEVQYHPTIYGTHGVTHNALIIVHTIGSDDS